MVQTKRVNGHKYQLYDIYGDEKEAHKKGMELKIRNNNGNKKFRYFVEEITGFGGASELFFPATRYHLWITT